MKAAAGRQAVAWGLGLFALTMPLSISAANAAWGIILLGLLAVARAEGRVPWPRPGPLAAPWAMYLLVVVVASLLGVDPARSFRFLVKDLHKVWLFYLFAAAFLLDPRPRTARWLLAGSGLAILLAACQVTRFYVFGSHEVWLGKWYEPAFRAHGTTHPVTYAEQLVLVMCGAAALVLRPDPRSGVPRWSLLAFLAMGTGTLLLTQTRGAWLAGGAAGLVLLVRGLAASRGALAAAGVAASLAAAGVLLPPSPFSAAVRDRMGSVFDAAHPKNAGRIELWKTALAIGRDHPALGVGLNNYWTVFEDYHPEPVEEQKRWGSAHNVYLHQLAERGGIGLGVLLWLLLGFWWFAWRAEAARKDAWSLWALSASTAQLVMNLTESAFQDAMVWMLFLFVWVSTTSVPPEGERERR